jgi:hypothetical protein
MGNLCKRDWFCFISYLEIIKFLNSLIRAGKAITYSFNYVIALINLVN